MIGNQGKIERKLFVNFSIEDFVPKDHIFRKIDKVMDFSWIREEVEHLYCADNGRPSIDPEVALRLMVGGFFEGVVHDRKLCRKAASDLALRWFARLDIDAEVPDHSTFSRLRQRWGEETFKRVFERVLEECVERGFVNTETVHVDSTLVRANVSWSKVVKKHVGEVVIKNQVDEPEPPSKAGSEKVCLSDPDASLATSSTVKTPEPSYKHHTAVDANGFVVSSEVTTGSVHEGHMLLKQVDDIEDRTGEEVVTVTADKGYASAANYANLEEMNIEPLIPPRGVKVEEFKYDGYNEILICRKGKRFGWKRETEKGLQFRLKAAKCRDCEHYETCFRGRKERYVLIRWGHCADIRQRRKREKGWDADAKALYGRHRNLVEGVQGEMKNEHGMRRSVRQGLWNMRIQAWLTSAVINLKRLAKGVFGSFFDQIHFLMRLIRPKLRPLFNLTA